MPVAGKPLLEYQIELCKRYGLSEVVLIVNHLKQHIMDHFQDGAKWGIDIRYFEEPSPLGTVGGIKEIEEELNEDFLVLYGDVMMDMNLERLYAFHTAHDSEATLVVHPNDHPYDSDLLEVDDNDRVVAFHSKPHAEGKRYHNLVNAAAYIFSPSLLDDLEKGVKADFGKDIFPKILDHRKVYAYNTTEYLKDMGTPDRLTKVTGDLESGKIARRNLSGPQKAIFLDRDGVLNYDTDLIHKTEDFTLYDYTAETLKRINRSDYLAIVTTNQSIIARGLTDLKGLGEIHKKMEWQLGEQRAYVDAIYFCPHHPDGGFPSEVKEYKIECDCRKPKPGMLLKAAKRFNIDLSQSFMIGDSERDAQAGNAAGVTTVGVRTGHGLKNAHFQPDFFVQDFKEAVDLIFSKEASADAVLEKIPQDIEKNPFVINLGGNARSGKSTLAKQVIKKLEDRGQKVLYISLDQWILPKSERSQEIDVFHNFQMPTIEQAIPALLHGEPIAAPGYAIHKKRKTLPSTYKLKDECIVLIDGVVALSSPVLRDLSDLKLFKEIEASVQKERLKEFYDWKEYKPEDFERLYEKRVKDEYEIIAKDRIFADLIV